MSPGQFIMISLDEILMKFKYEFDVYCGLELSFF